MIYTVHVTLVAEVDINELQDYLERSVESNFVENFIDSLVDKIESLSTAPERGHYPPELECQNKRNVREIHFKSQRIIYEIVSDAVVVYAVINSRRDVQDLLQRRLLRP